jgi:two-component system sensor histidine kinase/response regulator
MDGFELAELMRGAERTKHVPIIFVTAGARDPMRVFKGYETGAVDFLFKPIDPRILKGKADVFFELHRQRAAATQALRLNEMFVGILGHDLRNPLSAMLAGAQLLQCQITDEEQQRTLRRMTSAGQRMTGLIAQLLDLTRARLLGGIGFSRVQKRVDVGSLAQRAIDELSDAHPEREIKLEAPAQCITVGDADRLLQLLSNLVANALQHGTPGTPVEVSVRERGLDIFVDVHNAGVIPGERLGTLFDPFRGRQKDSLGLGLGLFIAQEIAVAHGGSVNVESSELGGTRFIVRLPLRSIGSALPAA